MNSQQTHISTSGDVEAAEAPVNSSLCTSVGIHITDDTVSSSTETPSASPSTKPTAEPSVLLYLLEKPSLVPVKIFRKRASIACYVVVQFWKGHATDVNRILDSLASLDIAILAAAADSITSIIPSRPLQLHHFPEYAGVLTSFIRYSLQETVDPKTEIFFDWMMGTYVRANFRTSMELKHHWRDLLVCLSA